MWNAAWLEPAALLALPALTLMLVAAWQVTGLVTETPPLTRGSGPWTLVFATASSLAAVYAGLLAWRAHTEQRGPGSGLSQQAGPLLRRTVKVVRDRTAEAEVADLKERLGRYAEELRAARDEIDLLSALREVAFAVNFEVEFQAILEKVVEIVDDLIDARDLTIFLPEQGAAPSSDGESLLVAWVHRESGRTTFGQDIPGDARDATQVQAAVAERDARPRWEAKAGIYSCVVLLAASKEITGAIRVRVRGEDLDTPALEARLTAVAKHLAMATDKPRMYDRAVLDALTGLYNKRHFEAQLAKVFAGSRRLGNPLALLLADIDHFKRINDTHGHLTGDIVLADVAALIRNQIREYDSAFRYGGEEMAVILPEAGPKEALIVAERIRSAVEQTVFRGELGQDVPVTLSLGVGFYEQGMSAPLDLVSATDKALYSSKEDGRNRTTVMGMVQNQVAADGEDHQPGNAGSADQSPSDSLTE